MPIYLKKVTYKTWLILITICSLLLAIPISILFIQSLSQKNSTDSSQWITPNEAIEKGVNEKPYKILEVTLRYDKQALPAMTLKRLIKKTGHAPTMNEVDTEYVLEALGNNEVLQRLPFSPPDIRQDPPPQSGEKATRNNKVLDVVDFVVTIPWNDNMKRIRIIDNTGKVILVAPTTNVIEEESPPNFQSIPGVQSQKTTNSDKDVLSATNQKLDIAFIGESYTNMSTFRNEVTRFKNTFLTHEPFKSRASQIVFHLVENTSSLQCQRDPDMTRLLTCNDSIVISKVNSSGVPYDQVVVIVNTPTYGGSGGGIISVTHRGESSEYVSVHEFGHSFGRLADEYTLYEQAGTLDNQTKGLGTIDGNCYAGNPPAAAWNGIVTTSSYARGCMYSNWYRSSQSSIMYTNSGTFNAVSLRSLHKQMDYYTKSTNSPTTRPTSPIVSKKPDPTRKPSPTPGGKPADLVVSDLKLTDEGGNVKTNFAPNEKIYILVTHYNQGGSKALSATGITHSRFYTDRPNDVTQNTDSDVGISMRDGEYGTRSTKSYGSSPAGPNAAFFNNKRYFTKSAPGTYTARHYINFNGDVFENNANNNQKTLTYTVGGSQQNALPNPKISFGPTRVVTGVVPTLRPSPPPMQTPKKTLIEATITFPWLNNSGDNAVYTYRVITLEILDKNGKIVATPRGTVLFKEKEQLYTGIIDAGEKLPTGIYSVKIKAEDTLKKKLSELVLTQGQLTNLPLAELISGDLNGDNRIDDFDIDKYRTSFPERDSISLGCFGSKSCSLSDIDDNGKIDLLDYNILLEGKKIGDGD